MNRITVKVVNRSGLELPAPTSTMAAGMDVRASLDAPVTLAPGKRALIPTGLRMQIPRGYECQIRPRSGLALNHGITVLNTPGTVDADSRAEIGVVLINLSDTPFTVNHGDRICQMVFKQCMEVEWEPVREIDHTKRGDNSFGGTGLGPAPGDAPSPAPAKGPRP